MIPQTCSTTIPPDSSAQSLLRLGKPFVEFPRYSILDLRSAANPKPFSEWLTKRLQLGKPFVISDFQLLEAWDPKFFGIEKLIDLSTKKNIPVRNCSTGRDLSFTLRKFADAARNSYQEFQNLYARDLQCPQEWQEVCRKILPSEVQWGGRLDLFQWLPAPARSEVMMAYVGSEGSSSGFHRCFSSTVALNLLVDSDDRPVVSIGTDFESQQKYDAFMLARGISPHVDWLNLGTEELLSADFPLYVHDQRVGDLVVFPPATAHQVWNPSTLSTKLVWNILHPLSLEVGFQFVQPLFNRLCRPDVARTNLSLACAMLSLVQDSAPLVPPPDLPLLSRLFRQIVHDESIEGELATSISLIQISNAVIATCNFCSTAIWNRHVRCTVCADFDLCLACYLYGRSCEHSQSYAWAELVLPDQCTRILNRAHEILGFQPVEPHMPDRCKTLGTAVNDLMKAKQSSISRLCHLCRIDHPEWKGRRCDKCTAFFCYRGLYRHFDQGSGEMLKHSAFWTCPKCYETCNCRCCHFSTSYVKTEKPASKQRVKPADSRGKVMGFTDNVFDQKRGLRGNTIHSHAGVLPDIAQIVGRKRQTSSSDVGLATPSRKLELPSPKTDFANRTDMRTSRESSDYLVDPQFAKVHSAGSLPSLLSSMKSFSEQRLYGYSASPIGDRPLTGATLPEGMSTLASATSPYGRKSSNTLHNVTTLPPMLAEPVPPKRLPGNPGATELSLTASATATSVQYPSDPEPGHSQTASAQCASGSPSKPGPKSSDDEIRQLEERISALRAYEEELLSLKLEATHKMLSDQLLTLETELRGKKKQKSLLLIERLEREGFAGLAQGVKKETAMWGGG